MRNSLRAFVIVLFCTALGATTASGQTFELFASESDLTPQDGSADAQCLVQLSNGTLVFFNSDAGGIYTWDGSSLGVHTSSTSLNSNISAESNLINRCDAAEVDINNNVYFSFRNDDSGTNYVYRTEAADANNFTVKELDGVNGLAVDGSTLYLGIVGRFDDSGAFSDGIYKIPANLSGSAQAVATNADIGLEESITVSPSGTVYGYSVDESGFGSGSLNAVVVSVDPSASSPSFEVFLDPYASGTAFNGSDAIIDLDAVEFGGVEYIVAFNNDFTATDGVQAVTIRVSDQSTANLLLER